MPKTKTVYRCTECGAEYPRWQGRCETCGEWNTLVEEIMAPKVAVGGGSSRRIAGARSLAEGGSVAPTPRLREVHGSEAKRWKTGIDEFDFVLGGGIVPGSMILIGGEPGIGKSTILLQVAARLEANGHATLYASGEESALQVKLRADRISEGADEVSLLSETNLETILATSSAAAPAVLMVDSIQTVFTADLEGAPGNVGQVRECAARLMRYAKESGTTVFVVGHVTKGGGIAGPKTLEHIVDTVLYFEGESTLDHRLLRATKNRFGSVDEIGVFRMSESGLEPVANPSELFLGDRASHASGSAVTALLEGTRPVLVEIQALAAKAGFGTPQRVATGFDGRKLALLLAVLDKRAGLAFSQLDVFLNVVGGVRLQEPAGDLAVAAALASSVYDRALPADAVFIGEVGLGGEVRPVSQVERRVAEAANMGMRRVFLAERGVPRRGVRDVEIVGVRTIQDLLQRLFP
ncbi:MAG TPA: DNA repair protein RadA [Gemmatimonadaceae bacterium]|jgi:DNA repair protein RadA/Sms|nr:DNA repair protein RadA [Gemmatimonadaceae bacterium]